MQLNVDFSSPIGPIKAMHGVGQPPLLGLNTNYFRYLSEAGIPYSRLHDVAGWFGGNMFVDIPNIFRDFDADETDPASYDFVFTDILMAGLIKHNCAPVYRLGVTIENFHNIKAYRVYPPKDFAKWARVCEHIIRHYNEGWADGYHMDIEYWEIWNEPDNEPVIAENPMWKGTMEEFFTLYEVTARHLKARYPHLKIGGYASCGFYEILNTQAAGQAKVSTRTGYFIEFFEKFLTHITTDGHIAPLDFFSWHSYAGLGENIAFAAYAREMLDKFGFTETESILNEWNPGIHRRGTLADASQIGAMMAAMQDSSVDMMAYYDGSLESTYGGMFNPVTRTPFKAYHTFRAWGELYWLGTQYAIEGVCEGNRLTDTLFAVAAGNQTERAVLLVNVGGEAALQAPEGVWTVCVLDHEHDLDPVGEVREGETFAVPAEGLVLLKSVN